MRDAEQMYPQDIRYDIGPVVSGFVSPTNADARSATPALVAERPGDGSDIMTADNPNFRGYWYGANTPFLNSLFFSRAFDAPNED